jgi:hypothetical protein
MTPDYKSLSRGHSRDMSSGTIDDRLDKVADLYELWKLLRTAKRSNGGEPPTGANRQRGRTANGGEPVRSDRWSWFGIEP